LHEGVSRRERPESRLRDDQPDEDEMTDDRQSPEQLLRAYFHAKDENRPHRMRGVFAADASLEMTVRSGTIAFPPATTGVDAITDVLVRNFGRTYENVYSFYLQRPAADLRAFSCDWLVGMSEKSGGAVRVGCGRYDWTFRQSPPFLVAGLVVTIESMPVLPPDALGPVMDWLTALPYPWCHAARAVEAIPAIPALKPVVEYLGQR